MQKKGGRFPSRDLDVPMDRGGDGVEGGPGELSCKMRFARGTPRWWNDHFAVARAPPSTNEGFSVSFPGDLPQLHHISLQQLLRIVMRLKCTSIQGERVHEFSKACVASLYRDCRAVLDLTTDQARHGASSLCRAIRQETKIHSSKPRRAKAIYVL